MSFVQGQCGAPQKRACSKYTKELVFAFSTVLSQGGHEALPGLSWATDRSVNSQTLAWQAAAAAAAVAVLVSNVTCPTFSSTVTSMPALPHCRARGSLKGAEPYKFQVDLLVDNSLQCSAFNTTFSNVYSSSLATVLTSLSGPAGISPQVNFSRTAVNVTCELPPTGTKKRIRLVATSPNISYDTANALLFQFTQSSTVSQLIQTIAAGLTSAMNAW